MNFKFIYLILAGASVAVSCNDYRHEDSVFSELDKEIEISRIHQAEKEKRIRYLLDDMASAVTDKERFDIAGKLINEYEAYNSDSALHYVNLSLANPMVTSDRYLNNGLKIKKADILSHAGLFNVAEQTLADIDKAELDSLLLGQYFGAYTALYQYQSEYSDDSEFAKENQRLREVYNDSVIKYTAPDSFGYIINYAPALARQGKYNEAVDEINKILGNYSSGEREYSILVSILADIFRSSGDRENYKRLIVESAVSDLRGVVKENMAMRALATICFEDGDLERANKYLKQSFADANFYSARMRNAQSSRMLPIIDEAYQARQYELQNRHRIYTILVSALAVILLIAISFLIKQIAKVRRISTQRQNALNELSELSRKLTALNEELTRTNKDLTTANTIKEEYAGLFMEYCSLAILNLQQYHQHLRGLAMKGNVAALMKRLDSTEIENKTWHEFYAKFDEAILNIYPQFVNKFNNLLKPDEQIVLKSGEKLNTELRVFALIRIGIQDSEKIAKFLRCSLSTIYTYRSKIKKRAKDPATFEKQLLSI